MFVIMTDGEDMRHAQAAMGKGWTVEIYINMLIELVTKGYKSFPMKLRQGKQKIL